MMGGPEEKTGRERGGERRGRYITSKVAALSALLMNARELSVVQSWDLSPS